MSESAYRTIRMAELVSRALPVGTAVRYFPVNGKPEHSVTRTRSMPWVMDHDAIVVKIDGRAGGVCVAHLEVI